MVTSSNAASSQCQCQRRLLLLLDPEDRAFAIAAAVLGLDLKANYPATLVAGVLPISVAIGALAPVVAI